MQVTDATGQILTFRRPFSRIVSLFPSQTYLLYHLGLDDEVVGITRFCKYPPHWEKTKRRVGGTKDPVAERIRALQPDLILANKEENTRQAVEQLCQIAPVYVSEVVTWADNEKFILDTGCLTGREDRARETVRLMNRRLRSFDFTASHPERVLYFIWRDPWMVAGRDTFIDTMLSLGGWENIAPGSRYPVLDSGMMRQLRPETVFLSSEPFPFREKHIAELKSFFPEARFRLVDGEAFTWFGAFPLESFEYFAKLHRNT